MGAKLLWTGLTIIVALPKFFGGVSAEVAGALIMIIGLILFLFDK